MPLLQEHLLGNQECEFLLNKKTKRSLWPWQLITEVNIYVLVIGEPSLRSEECCFVNGFLNCRVFGQ